MGIHPWHLTESNADGHWQWLVEMANRPQVVAIGEGGLDKLKGPSLVLQMDVFKRCVLLAEERSLPLIIHAVKCSNELIRLKKELRPVQPWIIHGYRGNPQITKQMAKVGFMFSDNFIGRRWQIGVRLFFIEAVFINIKET